MSERPTILVTGGASGIGYSVAELLLGEGARVVVADLSDAALAKARESLAGKGEVRFERLNVADEAEVVRVIGSTEAGFGPLRGIVNSAGIGADVPALSTGVDLFRKLLDVNLIGSFLVAREAAKVMRGRGGSIVNVASVSGMAGNEGRVAYGASKGGVITMTMVLAVEFAPLGIRVNAIAPGPIETPLVRDVHTPEARAAWNASVPQHRYGAPEDIAQAALFLLDDRKSGYVTGHTLCVDGGFMAGGLMTGTATGLRG